MPYLGALSVRINPSGGPIRKVVSLDPRNSSWIQGRSHIALFIHGYNVSLNQAMDAYKDFTRELGAPFLDGVCHFFWPGDEPWPGVSELSYAGQIRNARDSAVPLADFLKTLHGPGKSESETTPMSISLVAHSLGCRLALELLNIVALNRDQYPKLNVEVVALMAAAVPVALLEWPGRGLCPGAGVPRRLYTLNSESDWVLSWAFPQGQRLARLAGDDIGPKSLSAGDFDSAVGSRGEPADVFRGRYAMFHPWRWYVPDSGYGHGDYWPGAESIAQVKWFFNVPDRRGLPVSVPAARPGPALGRPGPAPRSFAASKAPTSRRIGA